MASLLARRLRRTPTDAEMRLWWHLRQKNLAGFRFRRQHPFGPYVVDFFCAEAKLIVEVDGGQHAEESDTRRRWIEAQGYRLIRFWNNDVLGNTEVSSRRFLQRFALDPPPVNASRCRPPPQGGRDVTPTPRD
jgi:very-short-patch-repair endonuclease